MNLGLKLIDFSAIEIEMAGCMSKLVEGPLEGGVCPESEKCAVVITKLKHDKNAKELQSYRPLHNTSFPSKVLESAATIQLLDHISKFESIWKLCEALRQNCSR